MVPHGPYSLTSKGQVSIPKELREEINLGLGDRVYFAVSRDEPRTLLVIPVDRLPDAIAHWGPAPEASLTNPEGGLDTVVAKRAHPRAKTDRARSRS